MFLFEQSANVDMLKIPQIAYDGESIDTLWDNHESSIDWFDKHLGLVPSVRANQENFRFDSNSQVEMMTFYPELFNLHSVITSKRLVHLFAERGTVDPNIRWCFQTKNLEKEHTYLKNNKIRVSDIYNGPGDKSYFDFWATAEGTRLTVVGAPELTDDSPRFTSAFIRVGVSDLQASVRWYQKFLGFTYVEDQIGPEWIEMNTFCVENVDGQRVTPIVKKYSIFLEKLNENSDTDRVDGPVRSYFLIENREQFEQYHITLKDNGVIVSPITDGFGTFHFYDPDGNRLNVWHY
jgi:catechol 2,3-dioxygenase-like lactoylglutathione lyase family enzyme